MRNNSSESPHSFLSVYLDLMMSLILGPATKFLGDFDKVFFWEKESYFTPLRGTDFGSFVIPANLNTLFIQYVLIINAEGEGKKANNYIPK